MFKEPSRGVLDSRGVLTIQNSLDNMIDDIGDEPEDIIAQNEHTVYSHTAAGDHIIEGTKCLERKEQGSGNSKTGIDAVNEVANVGKYADGDISEQRKAGVDASSEITTYVDNEFDESVARARQKVDASKSIPIKLCQHRRYKGMCIMRSFNLHGDTKKKEEKPHGICNNMDRFVQPVRNLKLHDLLDELTPKVANDTRFADKDANSDDV